MSKTTELVERLRELPRDTRKATVEIYDLCIEASYEIEGLTDRCARYAEEIMALREALKKVRGGWRDVVMAHALRCSSGVPTGKEDCEHCKYGQRIGDASDGAPLPDELIAIADEWTCDCDRVAREAAQRLEELGVMVQS